jgi:hypothetical protein
MLYPLSYEGGGWRVPRVKTQKPGAFLNHRGDEVPDSADGAGSRRRGSALRAARPARNEGLFEMGKFGGTLAGAVSPVTVEGEPVDHERVADRIAVLARVADAAGPGDPEDVSEIAVD